MLNIKQTKGKPKLNYKSQAVIEQKRMLQQAVTSFSLFNPTILLFYVIMLQLVSASVSAMRIPPLSLNPFTADLQTADVINS